MARRILRLAVMQNSHPAPVVARVTGAGGLPRRSPAAAGRRRVSAVIPGPWSGPGLRSGTRLRSGSSPETDLVANLVANLIRFLFRPAQTGNDSSRIPAAARQADRFQTYVPQIDRSLIPLKSFVVIVVAIVG